MAKALYDPEFGYYQAASQHSSRRGDYITSVEVGPLFGAVLARALDAWWESEGCPKEFWVFEAGAGVGTLARSILRAKPACLESLKYVMVEQSEYLMSCQTDLVDAEPDIFQSQLVGHNGDISPNSQKSANPLGIKEPVDFGVVIANELLDNLPFVLLKKTAEDWKEVVVALDPAIWKQDKNKSKAFSDEEFVSINNRPIWELVAQLVPDAKIGQRIPIQNQTAKWLNGALSSIRRGRVLIFDYGVHTTKELADRPQTEWLRTYRGQNRGGSPYEFVGEQDITCEIALDQLAISAGFHNPASVLQPFRTQRDFLKQWGIEELAAQAEAVQQPEIPTDLKSIELQSRIQEAKALLDPQGLGAHFVAEWVVG